MADTTTITSANSVLTLVIAGLFNTPVQIQGFSTDRAVVTDAIDVAETQMGVDGRMTAGYVPNPVDQTITIQADSPSLPVFETLIAFSKTTREVFYMTGTLDLPSTGRSYAMTRGVLMNVKQIPDLQKVLQPVDLKIRWESINQSLL